LQNSQTKVHVNVHYIRVVSWMWWWLAVADCSFTAALHGGGRCILDAVHYHRRPSSSFLLL